MKPKKPSRQSGGFTPDGGSSVLKRVLACCCMLAFCLPGISSGQRDPGASTLQEKKVAESRPSFLSALHDFEFIGSAPVGKPVETHVPIKPQDLPQEFKVQTQYVWLKERYADNDEIFKALQERLKSQGMTILHADGTMHRYLGGLAFVIKFKGGGYTGAISNTLDPRIVKSRRLNRQWGFDDYIVVFEETPVNTK